ncbi:MAG TPA: DUF5060 domain-containing protein [Tepidisphaeraceae bacterium]|jgi:hypothetical protein|nr:DUF5060 domain-containing protein [Tepidisphaeraceae bacterium]
MFSAHRRLLCYLGFSVMLFVPHPILAASGTYQRLEAAFNLPQVHGNPFDFTQNDVKVTFVNPDGSQVTLPAFFDGGQTWRVRHTPSLPGKYTIGAVTLNGRDAKPQNLHPTAFDVAGTPKAGFVRLDPHDNMRFVLDDGSPYYPVGYNLGWRDLGGPSLMESIARMGHAGVNWTRIWMCYWDGKNLDWANENQTQPKLGYLMLPVAALWDQIVEAADAANVHFHLVLQHHGEYSTGADANWQLNPWNKANGGWLAKPEDFFTDPKAIALTKSKFRYIIARWGYSPAIMAWELFNEVENTDAFKNDLDGVAAWHREMARFIRAQDPYHHLITTSSEVTEPKLWTSMDYYDAHVYPPDILSAIAVLDDDHLDRAYFYGEFGSFDDPDPKSGNVLHRGLWGSLMSRSSGAAQYWFWDVVEPNNLLSNYTAAQQFIAQSGLLKQQDLKPMDVIPETPSLGPLRFGPGTGWAPAKLTDFTIEPGGVVDGIGGMSAYLQGNNKNKRKFSLAVLHVDYPTAGTFSVHIDEITPAGARLEVKLDGQPMATLDLGPAAPPPVRPNRRPLPPRNPHPNATLELPVSQGKHIIRLENTGADWAHISEFVLTPYAPKLAVLAKGNENMAILWIYNRVPSNGQTVSGTLRVPGLTAGSYRVAWMNTHTAKVLSEETVSATGSEPLTLATPPIADDIAAWISRAQ